MNQSAPDAIRVLHVDDEPGFAETAAAFVEREDDRLTVETDDATLVADTDRLVRADRSRLRQLLENCIRNAVEHGGPAVTVDDLDDGFAVEDDGPGIPAAERDRVFEAGYSSAPGGTGLGLPIVQRVAEAHGWEVAVGESDDGGARFGVTGVELGR